MRFNHDRFLETNCFFHLFLNSPHTYNVSLTLLETHTHSLNASNISSQAPNFVVPRFQISAEKVANSTNIGFCWTCRGCLASPTFCLVEGWIYHPPQPSIPVAFHSRFSLGFPTKKCSFFLVVTGILGGWIQVFCSSRKTRVKPKWVFMSPSYVRTDADISI